MSQKLLQTRKGFEISEGNVQWLPSNGPPGATTDTQNAPVGAFAIDYATTPPAIYQKETAGAGTDKWVKKVTLKDVYDDDQWRQPAVTKDDQSWANLAAAETELNDITTPGSFGGVLTTSLSDGDRILFTNITGQNKNVFIVNGTPGSAATLVEDSKPAEQGDVIVIQEGNEKGNIFLFIDGEWTGEVGDQALLDALLRAHFEVVVTGVNSLTVIDSVVVDEATAAMWKITVENEAARANKFFIRVDAVHDGYNAGGGADASDADFNVFSELETGNLEEDDVEFDVVVSGSGSGQLMQLRANPNAVTVTVYAVREIVPFVANNPS